MTVAFFVIMHYSYHIFTKRQILDVTKLKAFEDGKLDVASCLTHAHTMTPFDAPGKQAF